MGKFNIQDENAEVVRNSLINHMGKVHKMVDDGCNLFFERFRRRTYVTPRSYLGFINRGRAERPAAAGDHHLDRDLRRRRPRCSP